jgi:hypothetical protein
LSPSLDSRASLVTPACAIKSLPVLSDSTKLCSCFRESGPGTPRQESKWQNFIPAPNNISTALHGSTQLSLKLSFENGSRALQEQSDKTKQKSHLAYIRVSSMLINFQTTPIQIK